MDESLLFMCVCEIIAIYQVEMIDYYLTSYVQLRNIKSNLISIQFVLNFSQRNIIVFFFNVYFYNHRHNAI